MDVSRRRLVPFSSRTWSIADMSVSLNTYLPHTDILRIAGAAVNSRIPTVSTCPFCGWNSLGVYADGDGGIWYCCRNCEFAGDSVELFARRRRIGLKAALRQLSGLNLFTRPVVDDASVASYLHLAIRRRRIRDFWKSCREALRCRTPAPAHLHLIQHYRLSLDWSADWPQKLGRFIGASTRRLLSSITTDAAPASNFLVLPYQDVPGRIRGALLAAGRNAGHVWIRETLGGDEEGGLFMLESTAPGTPIVYAVGDPLVALYLQRKHFKDSAMPCPIVAWNEQTACAWASVPGKIIFWDVRPGLRLFDQARRAGGWIASEPSFGSAAPYEYIRDRFGAGSILSKMQKTARPWAAALKDWILQNNATNVGEMLTALGLTSSEKSDLIEHAASENEQRRLSHYLGSPTSVSVKIDDATIIERSGRWILREPRKQDRTLSDAIIRLKRVLRYETEGKNYLNGVIEYKGRSIPFTDDMDRVRNSTYVWLTDKLMENELSMPTVYRGWARRLIEVAQAFEEPRVITISDRVGLKGETFNFPMFSISGGGFSGRPDSAAASELTPAADLEMPSRIEAEDLLPALNADAAGPSEFWALMSCLVVNTLHERIESDARYVSRRCIGLIGRGANLVRLAVEDAYSLVRVDLSARQWKKLLNPDSRHDLPTVLHHEPGQYLWRRVVTWREAGGHANIITPLPLTSAFCLSLTDNWVFVIGQDDLDELPGVETIRKILPSYIAYLQSMAYELSNELYPWYQILDSMRRWVYDLYPEYGDPEAVFEGAKTKLRIGSPDGQPKAVLRLLDLVIYLSRAKELSVGYVGYNQDEPVMIDQEKGIVRLDIERISSVIEKAGAPRPDWSVLIEEMKSRSMNMVDRVEMRLGSAVALHIAKEDFDVRRGTFSDQSLLGPLLSEDVDSFGV